MTVTSRIARALAKRAVECGNGAPFVCDKPLVTLPVSRREFLSTASGAAALLAAGANVAAASLRHAGRVQLGLTSPVYFNGFSPFLNWWKTASAPTLVRSVGGDLVGQQIWEVGGYLSPDTGEILAPAPQDLLAISRVFYKSANKFQVAAGCNYDGEEWTAIWDGSASGHIDFLSGRGSQRVASANRIDFTTGADPDRVSLVLTLTDHGDPPRNVRIFQTRYLDNAAAGERFNPDWLAEVRRFGVVRFMGWMPTNNETISDFSQLADENYFAWAQEFTSSSKYGAFGPKGSLHPKLICELANATGCDIHVCIPVRASNDFVRKFAEYFKANTNVEVTYELSNECWNPSFDQFHYCRQQGAGRWPGDFWGFAKWYGYRSAECMNIVRDVYRDANRWRGALATQTVDTAKTIHALAGVNAFRKRSLDPPKSLQVDDLFKSLYVTGYFGFGVEGHRLSRIARADPAVCVSKRHGFKNGQRVKLYVTDGPTQLNGQFVTVANRTDDTFELSGVSTLAMGTYLPPCRVATSGVLPQAPDYDNGNNGSGAALTATRGGALVVGGRPLHQGDVVLVKDQQAPAQNGVYVVAAGGDDAARWQMVRAHYFDAPATMIAGSSIAVDAEAGGHSVYVLDRSVQKPGRDPALFSKVEQDNYVVDATIFEMIDDSIRKHLADPVSFPARNTYFNRQVAHAVRYGQCDASLTVGDSVVAAEHVFWPAQKLLAKAHGLTLRQYEGGCGVGGAGVGINGNPRALVYGGNAEFGEFVFAFGHSAEVAEVYAENYAAFWRVGGEFPAKFVLDGRSSNAGPWAGVRFWPLKTNFDTADTQNPVWVATLSANEG